MEIDRALLTDEQRQLVDAWEEFFKLPAFQTMVTEAERSAESVQRSLANVKGEQGLGYLQGQLSILRWVTNQRTFRLAQLANEFGAYETGPQEQDSDPSGLA